VYVVILNWNGKEYLPDCLGSLQRQNYKNHRVLVVDNGSEDGSVELLKNGFSWVELIENRRNLGFSGGSNAGIFYALNKGANYIALLNNDTETHPDWLGELVKTAEMDTQIGVCGSKILFSDHRHLINSTGHAVNRLGFVWDEGIWERDGRTHNQAKEIIGACGAALFLRAEVLKEAGVFDEKYFAYYEDADLCLRIRKLGYRVVYVPTAIVYHKFSVTAREGSYFKNFLGEKNHYRFFLKLFPWRLILRGLPLLAGLELMNTLSYLSKKEWVNAGLRLKILGITLASLPEIIGFRVFMAKKTKDMSFWSLIRPTDRIPDLKALREKAIEQ